MSGPIYVLRATVRYPTSDSTAETVTARGSLEVACAALAAFIKFPPHGLVELHLTKDRP